MKLAFSVRLVGDELAMHVTAEASLGCLVRSKGCSVLGKVGDVGPWYSGGRALRLLRAVHWALGALTLASRADDAMCLFSPAVPAGRPITLARSQTRKRNRTGLPGATGAPR